MIVGVGTHWNIFMIFFAWAKPIMEEIIDMLNAVVDRTEPNLPNTKASVRYYSVRWDPEIPNRIFATNIKHF